MTKAVEKAGKAQAKAAKAITVKKAPAKKLAAAVKPKKSGAKGATAKKRQSRKGQFT